MEQIKLHSEAVSEPLWTLLQALMSDPKLKDFSLVGGTALALILGHRRSDDIYLFTTRAYEAGALSIHLEQTYSPERIYTDENTINAFINGIKVDLMTHPYPVLGAELELEGIRLSSLDDLAAMKLNAVSGRGYRKDFLDIAELLQVYSLDQMLHFFKRKYSLTDVWHLIRSLSYFGNAEMHQTPIISYRSSTWEEVKDLITDSVKGFLKG